MPGSVSAVKEPQRTVSEALCNARRALYEEKLANIQSDVSETREGVGKILRILNESNGKKALIARVDENSEFRVSMTEAHAQMVKEQKEAKRERRHARLLIVLTAIGWAVTIGLAIVAAVVRV